ncbi:MAG: preprotein translocase subunit TatA [Gammaproteobacteria bacterium RIFCSPLOWO2_01_FULL_47_190]|jgi:sec-independent protein translocase protein TatA|nr:MAG: preprotein translocase subunit TatA [Gammaproteobacteria bacterium RIFCSPLOWO2_01_FULL_47_190]OGT75527.1 MAG: preprotein translocase subunit TatA [Gammaproteobacteria bacterium RIFCSPLOWO2_12_47_11]OGT83958.1 MAG: preprotein translocase subunit TatA [Gammaproteobacteria bacterium RIFCSPLOWO2_12_FULL_47_76]
MGISIWQLLIILIIVALLFGTKKLRNIGGDLGSAIKSFRKAASEAEDDTTAKDSTPKHGNVIEGETKSVSESDNKPS